MGRIMTRHHSLLQREEGESLTSVLVGLALSSIALATAFSSLFDASRRSQDLAMFTTAQDEAQHILSLLTAELRMAGAGMPTSQSNFPVGGTGLGDAPEIVLATSNESQISFRLNETGVQSVLTTAFTPSTHALTFNVNSSGGIFEGDYLYLSDLLVLGDNAMRAKVTHTSSNSITIGADFVTTSGTTFEVGSTAQRVATISYQTDTSKDCIVRIDEGGRICLGPRSSLSVAYFDQQGAQLIPPLTASTISTQLTSVRIAATVVAPRKLSNKQHYSAVSTQLVTLRNLILSRGQ